MIRNISLLARYDKKTVNADYTQKDCGDIELTANEKTISGIRRLQLALRNTSDKKICLNKAFTRLTLEPGPYEVYSQVCHWGNENQAHWQDLKETGIILCHKPGRTTEGNAPYCAIRRIGEERTLSLHLLPFGNWRIRIMPIFHSNSEPAITVDLGICDEELAFDLEPGESLELPEILIQKNNRFEDAMPELHAYLRDTIKFPTEQLPVIFNTWFDRFADLQLDHLRDSLQAAAEVGCETFVIDAGWFGYDDSWEMVGDWREKPNRAFFGKMKDFADEVRSAGLDFGIWLEPERYAPEVPVVQAHPEWFRDSNFMGCKRIDLQNQEAYAYLKNEISRLIEAYDLKYIKFDMNATLGFDETGCEFYKYQHLFLELLDQIKQKYPEVILENCSSGGMRCELTTLTHFDAAFVSDNVNPFTMLSTLQGIWRRYLPGRIVRWSVMRELTEYVGQNGNVNTIITPGEATFEEYERVDLESLLVANFTGGLFGFTGDIASLSPDNRKLVKKYIDLYKSRREFMMNASGIWLHDTPREQQFQLEYKGNAIVYIAYMAQDAAAQRTVYPKRLDPDAMYDADGVVRSGKDLMQNGIKFDLVSHMHKKWRCTMKILDKVEK